MKHEVAATFRPLLFFFRFLYHDISAMCIQGLKSVNNWQEAGINKCPIVHAKIQVYKCTHITNVASHVSELIDL